MYYLCNIGLKYELDVRESGPRVVALFAWRTHSRDVLLDLDKVDNPKKEIDDFCYKMRVACDNNIEEMDPIRR